MEEELSSAWDKMWSKLNDWLDVLVTNIPNMIIAAIVFILALVLSRYLEKLVYRLLHRTKLQATMKNLIARFVSIAVILVGLFLVLGILNLSKALNTILAGAGVAGLAVGLALQGALANTYSGIVLSFIDTLKIGDWIETNDLTGEVVDISLRAMTLKQVDNNLVVIPNKLVVDNPIKNFSLTSQSRVILTCGVAYDSDLEFVQKLVKETITTSIDAVENKDDVIFFFTEFADSSINFEARFWINSTNALEIMKAKGKAIIAIKKAFDKNDINIPFPIRTLDFSNTLSIHQNNRNVNESSENTSANGTLESQKSSNFE